MKHKIMRNLVNLEKCLNLNDQFQKLSRQKKIFCKAMLDNVMKGESPTLNYCMMLMGHGPNAFTQFIDILIKTTQNFVLDLILNTTLEVQW